VTDRPLRDSNPTAYDRGVAQARAERDAGLPDMVSMERGLRRTKPANLFAGENGDAKRNLLRWGIDRIRAAQAAEA